MGSELDRRLDGQAARLAQVFTFDTFALLKVITQWRNRIEVSFGKIAEQMGLTFLRRSRVRALPGIRALDLADVQLSALHLRRA